MICKSCFLTSSVILNDCGHINSCANCTYKISQCIDCQEPIEKRYLLKLINIEVP